MTDEDHEKFFKAYHWNDRSPRMVNGVNYTEDDFDYIEPQKLYHWQNDIDNNTKKDGTESFEHFGE